MPRRKLCPRSSARAGGSARDCRRLCDTRPRPRARPTEPRPGSIPNGPPVRSAGRPRRRLKSSSGLARKRQRTPTPPEISLQLLRDRVQELGKLDVLGGDALGVVCREVHRDAVIDVEPFRMMVHFLDSERGRGHETKGVDEIGEFVFLVELALDHRPGGELIERVLELLARKLSHTDIMRQPPSVRDFYAWPSSRGPPSVLNTSSAS